MSALQAIILAIIEGITEFLPISSTGHLILTTDLLKIPSTEFVKSFEIIIQLGAILAIVILYRQTLIKSVEVWKRIIIAFLPTAILGLLFYKVVKIYLLGNSMVVIISLFIGGSILIIIELLYKESANAVKDIEKISLKNAFYIGLSQSISMIPGVSRAGATIIGGLLLGLQRKTAAEFSFLLAVPTMAAATALDITKSDFAFNSSELLLLMIGFSCSFITALFTVKLFVTYLQKNNFIAFGVYRLIVAIIFWTLIIH